LAQRTIEDLAPLSPDREFAISRHPPDQVSFCHLEKLGIFLQATGDLFVKLKTSFLNSFMVRPHGEFSFPFLVGHRVPCQEKSKPGFCPQRAAPFKKLF